MRQTLSAKASRPTGVESRGLSWFPGSPSGEGDLVREVDPDSSRVLDFGVVLGGAIEWLPRPCDGFRIEKQVELALAPGSEPERRRFIATGRDWALAWHGCRSASVTLLAACLAQVPETLLVLAACDLAEELLPYLPDGETRPQEALEVLRAWAEEKATVAEARRAIKECGSVYDGYTIASVLTLSQHLSVRLRRMDRDRNREAVIIAERAADVLARHRYGAFDAVGGLRLANAKLAQLIGQRISLSEVCLGVARQSRVSFAVR